MTAASYYEPNDGNIKMAPFSLHTLYVAGDDDPENGTEVCLNVKCPGPMYNVKEEMYMKQDVFVNVTINPHANYHCLSE